MPNPVIHGYEIQRLVAKGGMAEVYLAEQISLGREVAIKVLYPKSDDEQFTERFLHEARLVARLNNPNVITIYDFGALDDGRFFLSMEYLHGGDLEQRLRSGIGEGEAIQILAQLSRVLEFVHQQGIVHRDIKPANVLFRQDGSLVLTDFGIAKKVNNDVSMTRAGMAVGSPAYSSPEQAQGKELDQRADIYSLGVVLLEMLTGSNPFKSETYIDTVIKHVQMDIPLLPANLSKYQGLLNGMLAKLAKDRFQSLTEVLRALETGNTESCEPEAAPAGDVSYAESGLDDFLDQLIENIDENEVENSGNSYADSGLDDFLTEQILDLDDDT
jgi:serine/threonine protein kinase